MRQYLTIGGGDYYDATADLPHRHFKDFHSAPEDYFFHSATRQRAVTRIRREVRNNPYLAGLYASFPGAVGYGQARSRTKDRAYNDQKDLWWYRYAKHVTTAGDSLRRMQMLRHAEMLAAGEIFLILLANGRMQLVPSEYCGSPDRDTEHGEMNGVVYNAVGRPIAYRFGVMEKWGTINYSRGRLVSARYVIHDYHKDRILMGRGLPWLLPSLAPARDLYEITQAKTKQIKDASKFVGTLESADGSTALDRLGDPLENPTDTQEPSARPIDQPVRIALKDGTFLLLNPGEKLNLLQSQYQAADYKELLMIMLHSVAAPVGIPVELWFSGLGDVNFSGFKGLATQWGRRRREIIEDMEENVLDRLHFWRASKAVNEGDIPMPPDNDFDMIQWAWPRTAVLDHEREAKTNETRLKSGDNCLTDVWEERGQYTEEELDKRRQLWIQLEIAGGRLEDGGDHSKVEVPREFLMRGELPGAKGSLQKEPNSNSNEDAAETTK